MSGGVWECGKPVGFSIISMPQSEGGKGEVTFSLRPRRGRSLAPPFPPSRPQASPPQRISFCYFFFWRCAYGYGSAGRYGAAAGIVS